LQDSGVSCKPFLFGSLPLNSAGLGRAFGWGGQFPFCNPKFKNESAAAPSRFSTAG